jgi:hypothetical protein
MRTRKAVHVPNQTQYLEAIGSGSATMGELAGNLGIVERSAILALEEKGLIKREGDEPPSERIRAHTRFRLTSAGARELA